MSKEDSYLMAFLAFIGGFAICFIAACAIGDYRRSCWQHEAVESDHAEYVITDPATGVTEFRWKESK